MCRMQMISLVKIEKNIIKASTPKFTVETHENKSSEEMKSKDP